MLEVYTCPWSLLSLSWEFPVLKEDWRDTVLTLFWKEGWLFGTGRNLGVVGGEYVVVDVVVVDCSNGCSFAFEGNGWMLLLLLINGFLV